MGTDGLENRYSVKAQIVRFDHLPPKDKMHHHFRKNKKVFVIMKDSSTFIDRWLKWEGSSFYFVDRGEVSIRKIRSIGIYKPKISITKDK